MRHYIRDRTAGATYFLTFNLLNRKQAILVDRIDLIRAAYRKTQQHQPFQLNAMVVLPDHIHLLLTLPNQDDDYSFRVSLFKAAFTRQLPKNEYITKSRTDKRERGIWQRRFYEHRIRDDLDFARHTDYIHYNPVKHGYVQHTKDWAFSTFHYWVGQGVYSPDWGDALPNLDVGFDD